MPLLKRNGKLLKRNGKLVTTDNPLTCECCAPPPPPSCNCCGPNNVPISVGPCTDAYFETCTQAGGVVIPGECCQRLSIATGGAVAPEAQARQLAADKRAAGFTITRLAPVALLPGIYSVAWACYRQQALQANGAACVNGTECAVCQGDLQNCINAGGNPLP